MFQVRQRGWQIDGGDGARPRQEAQAFPAAAGVWRVIGL